jgi:hypothetical protein
MPIGHYPSDEPERDDEELRDPREIIRDIIGTVSQPSSLRPRGAWRSTAWLPSEALSTSPHNVGM